MDDIQLEERFASAAMRLGAHRDIGGVSAQVLARYREPHRHYHGISHLAGGLRVLDEIADTLVSAAEVELAFWFHDAVYATHPLAQNEERSAELAYEACLRMGIREVTGRRIGSMVRATKAHAGDDPDTCALFDVDLAILGSDPLTYATFERDVRAEYRWMFLEGIYRKARMRVLRAFLARPSIYVHERMRARYEGHARRNIEGALRELGAMHDEVTVHATDEHVFFTRAARLEGAHPWSDLYFVTHYPPTGRSPARLGVSFGPLDDRALVIEVDDPDASDVVARLRSVPGYRYDVETRPDSPARLVYSRERCGRVEAPVRVPAVKAHAAYR